MPAHACCNRCRLRAYLRRSEGAANACLPAYVLDSKSTRAFPGHRSCLSDRFLTRACRGIIVAATISPIPRKGPGFDPAVRQLLVFHRHTRSSCKLWESLTFEPINTSHARLQTVEQERAALKPFVG